MKVSRDDTPEAIFALALVSMAALADLLIFWVWFRVCLHVPVGLFRFYYDLFGYLAQKITEKCG